MSLTGRTRHRVQKRFGRDPILVLQVEEKGWRTVCHGAMVDTEDYIKWRDAKVEDLTEQVAN